jgi:hypothetical protein
VDAQGRIRGFFDGTEDADVKRLEEAIEQLSLKR